MVLPTSAKELHSRFVATGIFNLRHSGVAQLAERRTVNPQVVGSSPTPGAPLEPQVREHLVALGPGVLPFSQCADDGG